VAGLKSTVANQGTGLITQATCYRCSLQSPDGQTAEGFRVGRRDDFRESDLGAVNLEEVEQLIVILACTQIHEHGSTGIGCVCDMDIPLLAAIKLVNQPTVDSAKC
jgi:hypothetical protein